MISDELRKEIRKHSDLKVIVIIDFLQSVSIQEVSSSLRQVSNAVRDVQWSEVREAGAILSKEFGVDWNLEKAGVDKAALKDVTRVHSVSEGSLVLYSIVTAAAFWVLNSTLGETVKQAYKDTETHQRWKERLTKIMDTQILPQRGQRIVMSLSRKKQTGTVQLEETMYDDKKNIVTVKLTGPEAPSMPLFSEIE